MVVVGPLPRSKYLKAITCIPLHSMGAPVTYAHMYIIFRQNLVFSEMDSSLPMS